MTLTCFLKTSIKKPPEQTLKICLKSKKKKKNCLPKEVTQVTGDTYLDYCFMI